MKWVKSYIKRPVLDKILILVFASFMFVTLFADFLANDLPLFARVDNNATWPILEKVLTGQSTWSAEFADLSTMVVRAPVPYSTRPDPGLAGRYLPPFSKSVTGEGIHWLGTDRLGRDVLACLIYGCRKSLGVAFLSMLLAALLGIGLGVLAGYWKNKYPVTHPLLASTIMLITVYCGYLTWYGVLESRYLVLVVVLLILAALAGKNWLPGRHNFRLPFDNLLMRFIEVFQSVPTLLIILALTGIILNPGLIGLALIIGLLRWPVFARYSRGEVLKVREQNYVLAAKISGLNHTRIIRRYILPQAMGTLIVVFAFGVASVVLLESTLSFLGLGVPPEEITWGALLGQAKTNTSAWWLAIFPGLGIFVLVTSLNLLGDRLRLSLDPED